MITADDIFGYNPAEEQVWSERPQKGEIDADIYTARPADSVSEDGVYRSTIRIIMNPKNLKLNVVHQESYFCSDEDGFFRVISPLSVGDKNCPIFKAWKKLHFSGNDDLDQFAKDNWDKSQSNWCLIQVIEDENKPELVGQFKVFKLPKAIMKKLEAKLKPEAKKPMVRAHDFLIGLALELKVEPGPKDPAHPERERREISYDLSEFGEVQPIIKVGGGDLFDEPTMEFISDYAENYNLVQKEIAAGKQTTKGKAAKEAIEAAKEKMLALYGKCIEYVKAEAPDLEEKCAYKPWDEALTARVNKWIETKLAQADAFARGAEAYMSGQPAAPAQVPTAPAAASEVADIGDLPF
jgi:hypothetical protein